LAPPYCTPSLHDALPISIAFINADKRGAAQIFLDSSDGKGWKFEEILEVLNDPDIRFTTAPENLMRYASFMADVGSIKNRPKTRSEEHTSELQSRFDLVC